MSKPVLTRPRLDAIVDFIYANGPSSKAEVLRAFPEISVSSIEHALADLCREGSLCHNGRTPREYSAVVPKEGEY